MTEKNPNSDRLFAELFANARPRARVSREDADTMFENLHSEWQIMLADTRRRNLWNWAMAASVALMFVLGGALFLQNQSAPSDPVIRVAELSRIVGDELQLLDASGQFVGGATALQPFTSGQQLRSGNATRAALGLKAGGTLRLDEHTRVRFNPDHSITLADGRVYFDSGYAPGNAPVYALQDKPFYLATAFGEIHHIGTQFAAQAHMDHMIVSVREGEVKVLTRSGPLLIASGTSRVIGESGAGEQRLIPSYDDEWAWTQKILPPSDLDSPRVAEFLTWFGRETGLQVHYASADAKEVAHTQSSVGVVDLDPYAALEVRVRPETLGLTYELHDDQVVIRMVQ